MRLLRLLRLCVVALALASCADAPAPVAADAGRDAPADAPQRPPPPAPHPDASAEPTRDGCLAECRAKHPTGAAKDDAIVQCWTTHCAGACTDGADAGALETDAGTCKNPVTTFDPACDACTRARCCAAWDGCFDDDACTAYQTCGRRCPSR